jgi:hypothetical protein
MRNIMCKCGLMSPCTRIKNTDDLEILNCSYFEKTGCGFSMNEECCVSHLPDNQNFFYEISSYEDGSVVWSECGIGEIYSYGRKQTALKREFVFKIFTRGRHPRWIDDYKPKQLPRKAEYFIVNTYVPSCSEALATPNSVLCSVERFDPTPVELEDNTVLGRLNDKIQSIDGAELRTILTDDRIISAVKELKKPLILATNNLELSGKKSRVACDHIFLRPGPRPSKPRPGFLHYNNGLDCLEIFTSQGWASITTTPTG